MNHEGNHGLPEGLAKLEYHQADFVMVWPGSYVQCAVTGDKIPLENLRYWSVPHQEAYRDAEAAQKARDARGSRDA